MKLEEVLLDRFVLWEERGQQHLAGISRQSSTYIDITTGAFLTVVIQHGAQADLPVNQRASFLTSVCMSLKNSKIGNEIFSCPNLTREEALEQAIPRIP